MNPLPFISVEQTTRTVQLFPAAAPEIKAQPVAQPPVAQQPIQLEPFPFVPDPPSSQVRKVSSPATLVRPSKFIPAGCSRESDYESDYDGVRFKPRWTPAGSDAEHEPSYRKVRPPSSNQQQQQQPKRPSGVRTPTPPSVFDQPPSFDGPPRPVISPSDVIKIKSAIQMTDDMRPILVKPKAIRPSTSIKTAQQPVTTAFRALKPADEPVYGYADPPPSAAIARIYIYIMTFFYNIDSCLINSYSHALKNFFMTEEKAATHFSHMSDAFRTKAQHFAQQVLSDVQATVQPPASAQAEHQSAQPAPAVPESTGTEPQAYHEENRLSEFGIIVSVVFKLDTTPRYTKHKTGFFQEPSTLTPTLVSSTSNTTLATSLDWCCQASRRKWTRSRRRSARRAP